MNIEIKRSIKPVNYLKAIKFLEDRVVKINKNQEYNKFDPNTLNIFELLKNPNNRNKIIISHRLIDALILISLCLYFYINIIVYNNYQLKNFITFIVISIFCLTIDNVLENFTYEKNFYIMGSIINIILIHSLTLIFKYSNK